MIDFEPTASYKLIYIYTIWNKAHEGLLKIGETSIATPKTYKELQPNCSDLNNAAKKRIDQQTKTSGTSYQLLYTELAVFEKKDSNGDTIPMPISNKADKKIHNILKSSGIMQICPDGVAADEWFKVDLETAKNAIRAMKEGRTTLSSKEVMTDEPAIIFRTEQIDAIEKTINHFKTKKQMLWNAKMRFGKTLTSLELVKRLSYRRVIIVTHRPVVGSGWSEDFKKIFNLTTFPPYTFEFKKVETTNYDYDEKIDLENDTNLRKLDKNGKYFIYFASIQDLRGSKRVGGVYNKNNAIFDINWDLAIVDEAHEGTQTDLGENVFNALIKQNTKVLALSGTPFNILDKYDEDGVYTWDYIMEQKQKQEWDLNHPNEPNPYADLPKMHIYTYDLSDTLRNYLEWELEGKAFNFKEFFRVWTGNKDIDHCEIPLGKSEGDFIHESDVKHFLDLITSKNDNNLYPFSTDEYRSMFKHTLWMVPGVKEAKALSKMLRKHNVFRNFGIANVAGQGDDFEEFQHDDALKLVKDVIKKYDYSITLSCGKLTTGVTVKEWTAVFMLSGSNNTAAAGYMQTIFRVQSAGQIDGKQKTDCYVFDFAPDRTLKVLAETANISRRAGATGNKQDENREIMKDFLNFCPVISISGTEMKPYSVNKMMEQLKRVYAEKAIKSGFDDSSIYNENLMRLDELDTELFNELKSIVGSTKAIKNSTDIEINAQGFDDEKYNKTKEILKKPKKERTPEEIELLKERKLAKENRDKAISILRSISIRMPLLIYGADLPIDEEISVEKFVDIVDDKSWEEFMPIGVTKEIFNKFLKYYDKDIFIAAGKEIRNIAARADNLSPTQRIIAIEKLFSYFKNPDKETVLTPWRVVNRHMSETLGGWCFYNDKFDKLLEEPRFVNYNDITSRTLKNTEAQILEINSKSGFYPLYVAYSIYRSKLGDSKESNLNVKTLQDFWRDTLKENLYVICKTPMAMSITKRTLAGYSNARINAKYYDGLLNILKENKTIFINAICDSKYWDKEMGTMKFDAIVGNPPYQEMTGGAGVQAKPLYPIFVDTARQMQPNYISMIMPSRWFAGDNFGLEKFRVSMLNDKRIVKMVDFTNAKDCFPNISIGGGICYFLWDKNHCDACEFTNNIGGNQTTMVRNLNDFQILVRYNQAITILKKIKDFNETTLDSITSPLMPFGLSTNVRGEKQKSKQANLTLYSSNDITYYSEKRITKGTEYINNYKVLMSKTSAEHAGEPGKDGRFKVFTSSTRVLGPQEICTHSYFLIGNYKEKKYAQNLYEYLCTKFVRFLVLLSLNSINLSKQTMIFVPLQDFSVHWSDELLFNKYNLTNEEIALINSMIKPMSVSD